jgi:hypothetical protein
MIRAKLVGEILRLKETILISIVCALKTLVELNELGKGRRTHSVRLLLLIHIIL